MKTEQSKLGAKRLWVLARLQRSGVFRLTDAPSYKKAVDKLVDAGLISLLDDTDPHLYYLTNLGVKEIESSLQKFHGVQYDPLTFVKWIDDPEPLNVYRVFSSERIGEVSLHSPKSNAVGWSPLGTVVKMDDIRIATVEDILKWCTENPTREIEYKIV